MKDDIMDDDVDESIDDSSVNDTRLRALLARAAELPKSVEPPADAWPKIREAIAAKGAIAPEINRLQRKPALWQRPAFLLAAAAVLVIGSSAVTAKLVGGKTDAASQPVAVTSSPERARASGPATLAEFVEVEKDYIRTASQLSETLQSGEGSLAPETIAKLDESLRVIDAAILEARRALAADPANRTIVEMLSGSYEQKLDLLRRTTEMARS
ncbi:MAG: hypothetical protein WKF55_02540 [Gemmatimonadaceae bacterium]